MDSLYNIAMPYIIKNKSGEAIALASNMKEVEMLLDEYKNQEPSYEKIVPLVDKDNL